MDIAKAFDTVPHQRLSQKLKWYGVTGNTHQWISSFLSNHYQMVVIDNISSDLSVVTSGVPQGMVLGPTLFLIYMNDVVDNVKYSKIRLFADDIILYREISSSHDTQLLQNDLKSLQEWEEIWLLCFNIFKYHILKTTRAQKHNASLCVGRSKGKAGIQIQCIPEKRDTTSERYAHNCYINL